MASKFSSKNCTASTQTHTCLMGPGKGGRRTSLLGRALEPVPPSQARYRRKEQLNLSCMISLVELVQNMQLLVLLEDVDVQELEA